MYCTSATILTMSTTRAGRQQQRNATLAAVILSSPKRRADAGRLQLAPISARLRCVPGCMVLQIVRWKSGLASGDLGLTVPSALNSER